jgi:hypothetical protein
MERVGIFSNKKNPKMDKFWSLQLNELVHFMAIGSILLLFGIFYGPFICSMVYVHFW